MVLSHEPKKQLQPSLLVLPTSNHRIRILKMEEIKQILWSNLHLTYEKTDPKRASSLPTVSPVAERKLEFMCLMPNSVCFPQYSVSPLPHAILFFPKHYSLISF